MSVTVSGPERTMLWDGVQKRAPPAGVVQENAFFSEGPMQATCTTFTTFSARIVLAVHSLLMKSVSTLSVYYKMT